MTNAKAGMVSDGRLRFAIHERGRTVGAGVVAKILIKARSVWKKRAVQNAARFRVTSFDIGLPKVDDQLD